MSTNEDLRIENKNMAIDLDKAEMMLEDFNDRI